MLIRHILMIQSARVGHVQVVLFNAEDNHVKPKSSCEPALIRCENNLIMIPWLSWRMMMAVMASLNLPIFLQHEKPQSYQIQTEMTTYLCCSIIFVGV